MRRLLLSGLMVLAFSVTAFAGVDVSKLQLPGDITPGAGRYGHQGRSRQSQRAGRAHEHCRRGRRGQPEGLHAHGRGLPRQHRHFHRQGPYRPPVQHADVRPRRGLAAGKELYGIEVTNNGLVIFGGGELLKNKDGVIVGAVGVSGGSVAEDTNVAKAGVAAFK